ncbi:hypothetical protein [Pseudomonas sp.]|uniref:hypothetical protein n=1 Tax=Pseudomonas sp. TaxID=306 RepID=UPI0031CF0169
MNDVVRFKMDGESYLVSDDNGKYVEYDDYAKLEAENARLNGLLLELATRHFAESWSKRSNDKQLEEYLSLGIAQLEAETQALRDERNQLFVSRNNLIEECNCLRSELADSQGEVAALRARLVVDERAEFEKFAAEWSPQFSRAGKHVTGGRWVYHNHWQQNMWETWQGRARLNGKAVSEGLLRQVLNVESDDFMLAMNELRALLGEGKEHE